MFWDLLSLISMMTTLTGLILGLILAIEFVVKIITE